MFLSPLNVGVSSSSHCVVLLPVYRVYTFCFHNTVVSSCSRLILPVYIMQILLLVSVRTCGFNLFLKCVICQDLMRVHICSLIYGQFMTCFCMMVLGANFTMSEVASRTHSVLKTHSFYR